MSHRVTSDEETQQKFNLALSSGIKVRRHEKFKFAEVVTLYGEWIKETPSNNEDLDQLFRILWEPEVILYSFLFIHLFTHSLTN